jgi:general secretion pathway protein L
MARLLGIDATRRVVRTALLRTSFSRVTIEALGEVDVAAAGSEIEAIRAAVGVLRPDGVAISVSGERSFYRRLDLPAAAQKELASVLGFELEATVPFEMDEAVYDYRLLRRTSTDTIPVFAALARTEDVRERIRVVREAVGHEPERVGTGPLPLANLALLMPELEKPGDGQLPVAILDLAETTTEIVILMGGEAVFARTLSRGTVGLPESAPVLARELRQTLASWRTIGGDPLAGIYLVGAGASAQGAEIFLSTELGVPILPLPAPRIEELRPEHAARLSRHAKSIGLAIGLVGRAKAFNLRRGALEAERRYPFLREKIPLFAGLGAVIAVSFGFSVIAEVRTLDAEHELLLTKLAVASRDVLGEETTDPDHAHDLLDPGQSGADDDPLPRVDAFDVMVQLSKAVPKEIVHDVLELVVDGRAHAVIQGTVPAVSDAETIAKNLKDYKCFKDVKMTKTSQFSEGKEKYVLELDIKCDDRKKKKDKDKDKDKDKPVATAEAADSASASPVKPDSSKPDGGR